VIRILYLLSIQLENEAEGDGSSDHACIRDKASLSEGDLGFVTENPDKVEEADGAYDSCNDTDKELNENEVPRPWVGLEIRILEKREAKIGKDEGFEAETDDLQSNTRDMLALRRKVVPSIVCHHNAGGQERNNT
jgi:hypothetical protein